MTSSAQGSQFEKRLQSLYLKVAALKSMNKNTSRRWVPTLQKQTSVEHFRTAVFNRGASLNFQEGTSPYVLFNMEYF